MKNITETKEIKKYIENNFLSSVGHIRTMKEVMDLCFSNFSGDSAEIGCFQGRTTKEILEIVKKFNRTHHAIDPWYEKDSEILYDENLKGHYQAFLENTSENREHLSIIRADSTAPETVEKIQSLNLCFAFVDGLHTSDACFQDIMSTSTSANVIAVDDYYSCEGQVSILNKRVRDGISRALNSLNDSFYLLSTDEANAKPQKIAYLIRK